MRSWTGTNVLQWEHTRRWDIPQSDHEFSRADGALMLPGFSSLSIFFRRQSATAAIPFELVVWTAPIYFRPLDEDNFGNTPEQYLLPLDVEPSTGLQMTGSTARVYGARIKTEQAMGSLLFWQMKNKDTTNPGSIIGDIYVVPNYTGSLATPHIGRTVDVTDLNAGQSSSGMNSLSRAR